MNTSELRQRLKSKIDIINDDDFLIALNVLVESKTKNIIMLSDEQKQIIKNSQKEYLEGNYFTNDAVNEEMERWLQEE
jgi:c-di-GMP-binding flagellar brake protein YcgR